MSTQFLHEPDARRFVLRLDDELVAVLDYAINGSAVSFTRTFTTPVQRGKGFAAEIVRFAVDEVERSGQLRIIPMCWYVGDWFDSHPERAGLLTR